MNAVNYLGAKVCTVKEMVQLWLKATKDIAAHQASVMTRIRVVSICQVSVHKQGICCVGQVHTINI